ncbi:glycoside hydrolase family 3 N-terminal domain-containing protein [Bacteroides sp. KFT8]|uniref:glycoside hydrolase family 3 N-terminal domain-containing protein n=1 Tax=Bacteroides sp. KFT8 TaxID=2025659 RepID=UPI000C041FAC|nr:glycoside hydrolase family 3 N-terminal domain-containing protein [Bacteroides sp. KFT8]
MKRLLGLIGILIGIVSICRADEKCRIILPDRQEESYVSQDSFPLYKKVEATIEDRVADLLSRMNVREKILQLTQYIVGDNDNANNLGHAPESIPPELGSCIYMETGPELRNRVQQAAMEKSRLGIPMLFGYDAIHGFRTIYPIGLAQACSWNPELVRQANRVLAQETYDAGVNWTFAPMIDVCRDPRWGRIAEGFGEDPYTQGVFAAASVRGLQGDDLSARHSIASCLKHYVGYGASQAGIDYAATEISQQTLWDTYLPPFEAGVKAGAATVMSAFNDISGVPASANYYTLTEVLRDRWGFQGFVVTDWDATKQLISQGAAADGKEAAALSINAGVDMNMNDNLYNEHLEQLLKENKVSMERLDEAVGRVLRVKFRLGLFEHPYTEELPERQRVLLPESREVARKLSEESMVLLKNNNRILPLTSQKRIAMIGPLANSRKDLLGAWAAHGEEKEVISMFAGLKKMLAGKAEVFYAQGCGLDGEDTSGFAEALEIARQADVVMVCIGEHLFWSGENTSRSVIELPDIQYQLVHEMKKSGKPIVLLLASGRPIGLGKIEPLCDAILATWHSGTETGTALAGILTGKVNPSGKLSVTFPYSSGQIPVFYNTRQSSRTFMGFYQDIPSKPLYEFGYGLSYTSYIYGDIRSDKVRMKKNETLSIEIAVTNRGEYDGMETVHWFISDPVCRITRPVRELRHFEKKEIKKGLTETFCFELEPVRDLSYVDRNGERFLEAGLYRILVKDKQLDIWIDE